MDKKKVIGLVVAAVLAAVAYLWGPDVVKMVTDSVPEAPVVSEEEPAPTSKPAEGE
jgi:hypothetical protein